MRQFKLLFLASILAIAGIGESWGQVVCIDVPEHARAANRYQINSRANVVDNIQETRPGGQNLISEDYEIAWGPIYAIELAIVDSDPAEYFYVSTGSPVLNQPVSWIEKMLIDYGGVAIGTSSTVSGYTLSVGGKALFNQIDLQQEVNGQTMYLPMITT